MRPLRYSINVTLDGCCDHSEGVPDEESHRYWAASVDPVIAGHGPRLLDGLHERVELDLIGRHEFRSGAVALRYRPSRPAAGDLQEG